MNTKLSIIVPVYNVERYIRTCIESIFNQGLDENEFEVIIVNDGSTDGSMERISDITYQHSNITILNQENLSLSVARNNGIAIATGEYILMPDSDDLLIDYSLAPLLHKAIISKADLIIADFISRTSEEIAITGSKIIQPCSLSFTEKDGKKYFLEDFNPYECYVWRSLYRREFLIENNIYFVPGINYQDVPFTHECYLKANRCLKATWLLNIYRLNRPGAATSSFSTKKAISYCVVIRELWKLSKMSSLGPAHLYKIQEDIYEDFTLMIYGSLRWIKSSRERHIIIDRLLTETPELRFTHGYKQRIISFLLRHFPHLFITILWIHWQLKKRKD